MLSQEEDKGRSVPTGTASTSQQKKRRPRLLSGCPLVRNTQKNHQLAFTRKLVLRWCNALPTSPGVVRTSPGVVWTSPGVVKSTPCCVRQGRQGGNPHWKSRSLTYENDICARAYIRFIPSKKVFTLSHEERFLLIFNAFKCECLDFKVFTPPGFVWMPDVSTLHALLPQSPVCGEHLKHKPFTLFSDENQQETGGRWKGEWFFEDK